MGSSCCQRAAGFPTPRAHISSARIDPFLCRNPSGELHEAAIPKQLSIRPWPVARAGRWQKPQSPAAGNTGFLPGEPYKNISVCRVYFYIHIHLYTYMFLCSFVYSCIYTHRVTYFFSYSFIHALVHSYCNANIFIYIYIYIYTYIYTHTHAYAHMHLCPCSYLFWASSSESSDAAALGLTHVPAVGPLKEGDVRPGFGELQLILAPKLGDMSRCRTILPSP